MVYKRQMASYLHHPPALRECILFLVLEVTDTGAGMEREALSALLASLASPQGKIGYGMRNVDRRIRFAFGEGSGLWVRSIPGRGTKVEIRCRLAPGDKK